MDSSELIKIKRKTFPVSDLKRMFGIKKTESYWILKNRDIQTVTVAGRLRIVQSSFDEWYSNQVKYRIIGGPEPGENLRATTYSPKEIAELLGVSETTVYEIISRGVFETVTVDHTIRITRDSFESWYSSQERYRLPEDRERDETQKADTYSLPDIRRMLGVHRNTVYDLITRPSTRDCFEVVTVAGQKRVTIASFEKWYQSQTKYEIISMEDRMKILEVKPIRKPVVEPETHEETPQGYQLEEKEVYRLEDLMGVLNIGRKSAAKLIQTGELIAIKAGKSYMIPASEFKRYIEGRLNDGNDHPEE